MWYSLQTVYLRVLDDYSLFRKTLLNKLIWAQFNYWTIRAEINGLLIFWPNLFCQDGWMLTKFFVCLPLWTEKQSRHIIWRKRTISSQIDRETRSIKDLLHGTEFTIFLWKTAGSPDQVCKTPPFFPLLVYIISLAHGASYKVTHIYY